jgi:PPM family protein phosphatase
VAYTSIEVGDIFLMCSDGLSDLVSFNEIQEIIGQYAEEEAAKVLVKKAKQYGGHDNITLIVVKVLDKYETHLS